MSNEINTMRDLTNSILRYGGKTDVVWMKFANSRNAQKLVRPGFSARRYMANLVKHLSDNLVEKMISEGKILEKTLFKNSILLPHIRRRISADLSRYPEPYRILKQMLIAPGPLNEFSYIWKNSDYLSREASSEDNVLGMVKGDIKILSKKTDNESQEVYEEVQYAKMSHDKKKTVLSNLLLKSAMNHTLKINDEIVEYNLAKSRRPNVEAVQNVHIPVIKFDMREAVTDLLNKETIDTLSSTLTPTFSTGGFRGQGLKTTAQKMKKSEVREDPVNPPTEEDAKLHSNLLVNQANFTKMNYKLKSPKEGSSRLTELGTAKESQLNGFIENKGVSIPHKETIFPYGKHRDNEAMEDAPRSQEDDKVVHDDKIKMENGKDNREQQNRLIMLLTEHAESVAENVLRASGGGQDLASDVNDALIQWNQILAEKYSQIFSYGAITEISKQNETLKDQANFFQDPNWNFPSEHMKNQEQYGEMIKNVFKSIFKDQLNDVANETISISQEVMALLESGSNLTMDNIELCTDPETGRILLKLRSGGPSYDSQPINGANGDLHSYQTFARSKMDSGFPYSGMTTDRQFASGTTEPEMDGHSYSVDIKRSLSLLGEENDEPRLTQSVNRSVKNTLQNEKHGKPVPSKQSQDGFKTITDPEDRFQSSLPGSKMDTVKRVGPSKGAISSQGSPEDVPEEIIINSSDADFLSVPDPNGKGKVLDKKSSQRDSLKQSKEFVVGHVDDTKELKKLYAQDAGEAGKPKGKSTSQKSVAKPGKKKQLPNKKQKQEISPAPLKSASKAEVNITTSTPLVNEDLDNVGNLMEPTEEYDVPHIDGGLSPIPKSPQMIETRKEEFQESDHISDDGESDDDEEEKERKRLMRLERNSKRNMDAEKRRLDVQRKRKEKEEQRKSENKKRELEEELTKKLEEERRQKEEEWRLKREKEKADELRELDEMKREEYLRQKQIEKERRDKEEYNKKLEEMKLKLAIENQRKKEEQDRLAFEEAERLRIENEMISRMKEAERIEYLRKREEEEERKRLEEEQERLFREEQARIAFEEARRIAQQQARERAIIEARLNFIRGMKIENEGLKKYLNVTPSFVWSYFEFLKILGIEQEPAPNTSESDFLNAIL